MRANAVRNGVGASLIGLAFLLAAPTAGSAQLTVRSGISADQPLSYHLSALHGNSWLTRNGIWVRHDGLWAFRPTYRYDWQAYFRCQAGYGCGGIGWAPFGFSSWLPFGYGGWDQVPGGWLWFPGRRLSTSRSWDLYWDFWFFRPTHRFGFYGFGSPYGGSPHFFDARNGEQDLARAHSNTVPRGQDLRQDAAHGSEDPRSYQPGPANSGARPDVAPWVDPVRKLPVVNSLPDDRTGRPAGPPAPRAVSIDRMRFTPGLEPRAKDARRPSAQRDLERKANSASNRDRFEAARPPATARSKSPGPSATARTPSRTTPRNGKPSGEAMTGKPTRPQ